MYCKTYRDKLAEDDKITMPLCAFYNRMCYGVGSKLFYTLSKRIMQRPKSSFILGYSARPYLA